MDELTVVIQAGGESKRMGTPKAKVLFCGTPLIGRSIERLKDIADQLIITYNEPEDFEFISHVAEGVPLEIYQDIYDKRCALNGLYTALYYAKKPYVAIVACDMVFPSAELLKAEQNALIETGFDVAVPRTDLGYEPFHAVYRRDTCLHLIKKALDEGETRAICWYSDVRVIEFSLEDVLAVDPQGGSFININTPEDLRIMEQRVANGEITELRSEGSSPAPKDV